MNKISLFVLLLIAAGCAKVENQEKETTEQIKEQQKPPHKYGGWFCPDNLNGFPPVDIKGWNNVPVISNRLPTKEETQTGASLMYVDKAEYPDAKALDIKLPQLARYYNDYTEKEDLVIVIQAIEVSGDSVLGFRYLNGGNGSARYNEVTFLSETEIASLPPSHFVSFDIKIEATQDDIWKVLTHKDYAKSLLPTFNMNVISNAQWQEKANINFYYALPIELTSAYADKLFGCYYIQNDYMIHDQAYVEKFLLLENKEENYTELKVVCGPYESDFELQQTILKKWADKVKTLSEQL